MPALAAIARAPLTSLCIFGLAKLEDASDYRRINCTPTLAVNISFFFKSSAVE